MITEQQFQKEWGKLSEGTQKVIRQYVPVRKTEDCLMYYRYNKNKDSTVIPQKIFVAPNLVLLMLLEKLDLELADDEEKKLVLKQRVKS